ncbi:PAS domain S-box-containing protein [Clostridium acidisoli DSM 12555]|uniref:Circadian input-output histidine kinase CikA n=1 Tax=Clostridium acidisoli DSM 12555 TaxID=1121291 RepID=A0A1W1XN03_9CLOT|nr:PAS domain S-box protein [Clostridium acidisoli]SMC25370.1 PAS domain S-box-containing protein [Clostridium acidisoli DSM 12555]
MGNLPSKKNPLITDKLEIYKNMFENSKDIILLFDINGNLIDGNLAALKSYGYSKSELLQKNISHIRIKTESLTFKKQFQLAANSKEGVEFHTFHVRKDGSNFPVEVKSVALTINSEKIIFSVIRDISKRLISESELRILASIVEYSDDAIISKNLNGILTSWNNGAKILYGYTKEEIIGKSLSVLIPPKNSDELNVILDKIKLGEKIDHYETTRLRKDGKEVFVSISVSPIRDIYGNICGASTIARDITETIKKGKELREKYDELSAVYEELIATEEELRTNYEQLEESKAAADKANIAKTQFLANMSHEIRTPLNGIIGTIDLLNLTNLTNEQLEYITMLKSSSNILLHTINSILDISKIEAGKYEVVTKPFDLKVIIDRIIKELSLACSKNGLLFKYNVDSSLQFNLLGDSLKLNQILTNLISNAIKFTQNGYISFNASKTSQIGNKIGIKFSVEDSGIGIKDTFKNQIFKKFVQQDSSYTKTYQGTGLGLAISKELAKMMDGDIWFESKSGEGSTFYFSIELDIDTSDITSANSLVAADVISPDNFKNTILVVEDNEINMKIVSSMIKKLGYNFITAGNGMDAINLLKNNDVKLILMDVQMPILNGYDTTKIIRNNSSNENIPIVAMTAYSMVGDRELFLENGMTDYIGKPFEFDKLKELLSKYL